VAGTASSSIDAEDKGDGGPFLVPQGGNNQSGCDIILQQCHVVLPLPCMVLHCIA